MGTESKSLDCIILAAGKGTRMKSAMPKVLHPVAGQPMLSYVIDAAKQAGCDRPVVVTSPDYPQVDAWLATHASNAQIAHQAAQNGTAHAVLAAKEVLASPNETVMILFADSPLIQPETITAMQETLMQDEQTALAVLGFRHPPPSAYGRLVLAESDGTLERIVEAKDASEQERAIDWCNAGVMAVKGAYLWEMLEQVECDNAQNEYYLTDLVAIARKAGHHCRMVEGSETEALGVNSRSQLADIEAQMQQRLRQQAMAGGVTLIAPETVFLSADTQFGIDVTIEPHVWIGPSVQIGDQCHIRAYSHLEGAKIEAHSTIGPFARLRPGTEIGKGCRVGNFVEIKKAALAQGAKVSHLSYIGDASIGANANIGAGTITCNYDGYDKYRTTIGAGVFVGSNSALIAPVNIGAGAFIAAGSMITKDVPENALAVARSRQTGKDNWANRFREQKEKKSA